VEITYLIRIEGKTTRRSDFGSKLTLNHPSLVDKKKGPTTRVCEGEKRDRKTIFGMSCVSFKCLNDFFAEIFRIL